MSSKKLPAFQFYPGDWMKDPNLRRCTPAARGVWMDVLCLMHESETRGELDWPIADFVSAINGDDETVRLGIEELIERKVIKLRENGSMYSSRMVRDEEIRRSKVESGRSGGLAKAKRKASEPPSETLAKPRSSSSSSVSSSDIKDKGVALAFDSPVFKQAWEEWKTHRKEIRQKLTPTSVKRQMASFTKMGEASAIAAIYYTIEKGWTGIQQPKGTTNGRTTQSISRQVAAPGKYAKHTGAVIECTPSGSLLPYVGDGAVAPDSGKD
jgi:hypothetical protein